MKDRIQNYLGLLLAAIPSVALAGVQPAWVVRYSCGLVMGTNQPVAMARDVAGNLVLAGHGTGAHGDWDYLVLKFSPSGQLLWSARYADPGVTNDMVRSLAIDAERNVYVTGTTKTVKYNAGGIEQYVAPYAGRDMALDTNGNAYVTGFSEVDFATVKLDAAGSNVWTRTYNDPPGVMNISQAITVNDQGDAFIAGYTVCPRLAMDYSDINMIKYDTDGDQIWIFKPYFGCGPFIAFGEIGAITLHGDSILFSGNDPMNSYLTLKLNHLGDMLSGYEWSSEDVYSEMQQIKAQAEGYVLMTGRVYGDPVPYTPAMGTIKLDADLNQLWVRRYGEISAQANGLDLDAQGNVYVAGFAPVLGSQRHMPLTNDMVTIQYDPEGTQLWVQRYRGEFPGNSVATAVVVDPLTGAVYVAGHSQASADLTELVLIKYAGIENIRILENGQVELQFFGVPGELCQFQATTNFPDWEDIGTAQTDPDGVCRFTDTNAPAYPYRFYRRVTP